MAAIGALGLGIYLGAALPRRAPVPTPPAPASQPAPVPRPSAPQAVERPASDPSLAPADGLEAPREEEPLAALERRAPKPAQPLSLRIGPRLSEDAPLGDESVFGCVFNAPGDAYPVLGDSVAAEVDGRRVTVRFQPSGIYPGAKKAVVRVPRAEIPHRVIFFPTYDLGPEGAAPVKIIQESDGRGRKTAVFESPVDRIAGSSQTQILRLR